MGLCFVEPSQATKVNLSDKDQLVISCVGDSLTFGEGCSKPKHMNSYPGLLRQNPLFANYIVHNYGVNSMCVSKSAGKFSYWKTKSFARAMQSHPSIVVIMLGTNDAKSFNEVNYMESYIDMIRGFQKLPSKPTVYISIPPPVYKNVYGIVANVVNDLLPRIMPKIAEECHVKVKGEYIYIYVYVYIDISTYRYVYIKKNMYIYVYMQWNAM
jgi:acyl-CoA thioesterase-1